MSPLRQTLESIRPLIHRDVLDAVDKAVDIEPNLVTLFRAAWKATSTHVESLDTWLPRFHATFANPKLGRYRADVFTALVRTHNHGQSATTSGNKSQATINSFCPTLGVSAQ